MESVRDKAEHLLALKVMRLTRPSLLSPLIVTTDQKDLPGTLLNDFLKHDITSVPGSETIAASSFLLLPQCFGSIYLGETFSCYICIHNDSNQTVKDVTFKATLQTGSNNMLLSSDPPNSTDLVPGATVDEVIHHDVKEFGPHILTCEVSYCSGTLSSDLLSFRKFFKFEVLKPLDVKTKIYNAGSNEVCLEAQVQNITSGSLILENVSLETSPLFQAEKYNICDINCGLNLNIMAPSESKQFLYCTKPYPEINCDIKELSNTTYIGKLDIVWRSNSGERGRLQTSQLNRSSYTAKILTRSQSMRGGISTLLCIEDPEVSATEYMIEGGNSQNEIILDPEANFMCVELPPRPAPKFGDIYLSIEEIPSIAYLEEEFTIKFNVANTSDRSMDITLNLEPNNSFAWCSPSGQQIGAIGSNASKGFSLQLVPLSLGLQNVSGIRISEFYSKRAYEFDEVTQVYVMQREV